MVTSQIPVEAVHDSDCELDLTSSNSKYEMFIS